MLIRQRISRSRAADTEGEIELPPTFRSLISQNIYQVAFHSAAPASCCSTGGYKKIVVKREILSHHN